MTKKLIPILGVFVALLLISLGVLFVFNSAKSEQNNLTSQIENLVKTKAQTDITKLKKLPQYKDVSQSNWDNILNNLKASKSIEDFNQSYDWFLKGSLETYNSDVKENLISYKQLQEKIKNKEDFVVFFIQPRCPHCLNLKNSGFSKYLEEQVKLGKKVYSLNVAIEGDAWKDTKVWDKSKDLTKTKSDNLGVPGTPALAYFKSGVMTQGFVSEKSSEVQTWIEKLI